MLWTPQGTVYNVGDRVEREMGDDTNEEAMKREEGPRREEGGRGNIVLWMVPAAGNR